MKEKILENINNPTALEQLYRSDKNNFENAFDSIYANEPLNTTLEVWKERLHYKEPWLGGCINIDCRSYCKYWKFKSSKWRIVLFQKHGIYHHSICSCIFSFKTKCKQANKNKSSYPFWNISNIYKSTS